MQIKSISLAASLAVLGSLTLSTVTYGDAISPSIKDRGKIYSTDTPDTMWYGTGVGGRMEEASVLRFEVERLTQDGRFEAALVKAKKAVQMDPANSDSHVLLARLLSNKLYSSRGPIDEQLLQDALTEWRMLWHHDVDLTIQAEGKYQVFKLVRIEKALVRQHKMEEKAREQAKQEFANDVRRRHNELGSRSASYADGREDEGYRDRVNYRHGGNGGAENALDDRNDPRGDSQDAANDRNDAGDDRTSSLAPSRYDSRGDRGRYASRDRDDRADYRDDARPATDDDTADARPKPPSKPKHSHAATTGGWDVSGDMPEQKAPADTRDRSRSAGPADRTDVRSDARADARVQTRQPAPKQLATRQPEDQASRQPVYDDNPSLDQLIGAPKKKRFLLF
jgi:hypothetical protein